MSPRKNGDSKRERSTIPGAALARALRYVLAACPKDDKASVVFTTDDQDVPLVSAHDAQRSHTAFLPAGSQWDLHGEVERPSAEALATLLESLEEPFVSVAPTGEVSIRHGKAQPEIEYALEHRSITQSWKPPSAGDFTAAALPLRLSASKLSKACKFPESIAKQFHGNNGATWVDLVHQETGDLLARAVLAEEGLDLYPEVEKQTEIPGSRSVGGAVVELRRTLARSGGTLTVKVPGQPDVVLTGNAPAPGA